MDNVKTHLGLKLVHHKQPILKALYDRLSTAEIVTADGGAACGYFGLLGTTKGRLELLETSQTYVGLLGAI